MRINRSIKSKKAMTIKDSLKFSTMSITIVPLTMIKLCINRVKLLFKASVRVSTSLVKRLISSPWVWASK